MKKLIFLGLAGIMIIGQAVPAYALFDRRPLEEQKKSVLERSQEILSELYEKEPQSKAAIQSAYGYATFSNFGSKIFLIGGGMGRGVAVNNRTREKIFMRMAELQTGLGLGIKQFKLIWVFETEDGFRRFVDSGWQLGGQATAAAKLDDQGGARQGAISVFPGVWVYQLTGSGLALELTVKGTKYYRDDKLNQMDTSEKLEKIKKKSEKK